MFKKKIKVWVTFPGELVWGDAEWETTPLNPAAVATSLNDESWILGAMMLVHPHTL